MNAFDRFIKRLAAGQTVAQAMTFTHLESKGVNIN